MQIKTTQEVRYSVELTEREAQILCCLVGSLSPKDALELVTEQSMDAGRFGVGNATQRELTDFTGHLYDGLFNIL